MENFQNHLAKLSLGGSSTPPPNQGTNISQMNKGVQQVINYRTKIQESLNQIERYTSKIEEYTEEIITLRTQAQQFSQDAKKPLNSHMKQHLQDSRKMNIRHMEQLRKLIEKYKMSINVKKGQIREYTKKIKEGK